MAGMLAVVAEFEREILREQVKAGIAQARSKGKTLGRPKSAVRECRYPEPCIARKGLRSQRPDNWASAEPPCRLLPFSWRKSDISGPNGPFFRESLS
jgi:hypothetical protein